MALVIGNDNYTSVKRLENARGDARAIAAALAKAGYRVESRFDLDEKGMKAAFRDFKRSLSGGDEAVFFFAGHGVQLGAANYLLPVDIKGDNEDQVKDEAIPLQRVLDDIQEQKAKFTLAIIDACRDNPFKGRGRAIGGRGLAPTTAATGQMVIFSAGSGQQALDKLGENDRQANGLFTRIFLKEMQKPGLSVDRVLKNVRQEVANLASSVRHEQVPALYDQTLGEFYFFPGDGTQVAALGGSAIGPGRSAAQIEDELWDAIKDSDRASVFEEYISQYPGGRYLALAKVKISKLKAAPSPTLPVAGQKPALDKPQAERRSDTLETPAPAQLAIVKIAHVGPLTGGLAHLGKDNENGVRLAINEANSMGTAIGGQRVKFELMAEDDAADPRVGVKVAQKLVDARVAGVVGHLNSGVTIPASAIYNKAGIPVISGSATNPRYTQQGFKVAFRVVGRDDQQGTAVANYLAANPKIKTVAVMDDATAYGEGLADDAERALKARGITVMPRIQGTDRTTNWRATLSKVKASNPDAVFYGGMDSTGGPLLKQARELGINAVFAFGDGACTDTMAELAGRAAEGLICSQVGIPVEAASKRFLESYKSAFKADPILYAPFTYDATKLLIAAMQKAGSAEPAKYLPALAASNYTGATGRIRFDRNGDRGDAEVTIFSLKGGRIAPLSIIREGKSMAVAPL